MMPNPVTCYTELIQSLRERIGQLELRYLDFDKLAGFPEGLTGKAFGPSQVKRLGPEKLFDALRAAGLWIRLEEDPEQTRDIQNQIANNNFNPRQANQARPNNSANLSNKIIDSVLDYLTNKKGGLARLNKAVREARSNVARRASNANWTRKRELRHIGDFAAYREACLGNVSLLSIRPPPQERVPVERNQQRFVCRLSARLLEKPSQTASPPLLTIVDAERKSRRSKYG